MEIKHEKYEPIEIDLGKALKKRGIRTFEDFYNVMMELLEEEKIDSEDLNTEKVKRFYKMITLVKQAIPDKLPGINSIHIDEPNPNYDFAVLRVECNSWSMTKKYKDLFVEMVNLADFFEITGGAESPVIALFLVDDIWKKSERAE